MLLKYLPFRAAVITYLQVIGKLSSGEKCHVNYRDSKLTHILQNSLGMKLVFNIAYLYHCIPENVLENTNFYFAQII